MHVDKEGRGKLYIYIYIYIYICNLTRKGGVNFIYIYIYVYICKFIRWGGSIMYIYIYIYISSSSSYRAGSTDIPDPLSPLLPIVHRPRQVFRTTTCILT